MHIDLIIFDCDGTLVDSEYLNNLAVCELLAEQGLAQYDMDYAMNNFLGQRFSRIIEDIAAETGHNFPDDMAARYVARAAELIPTHLKYIDGAGDLVELAGAHTKICVGSNGQRDNVIYSLEVAGLLRHFPDEHIFAGPVVENPKPAPDLFLLAAEKLGAKPENTLVIEDSVIGVTAGIAARMQTWGFTGTHHDPGTHENALKSAGAHEVFSALIHIQGHLQRKNPFSEKSKYAS